MLFLDIWYYSLDFGIRRRQDINLHRKVKSQKNAAHTVLRVKFEPATQMLEPYKTTHAVVKGVVYSDRLSRVTLRLKYSTNTTL